MCIRGLLLVVFASNVSLAQSGAVERAIHGTWHVTGSKCFSECAMSRTAAGAWTGRTASYDASAARFAENSSKNPRYVAGHWPADGIYGGARLSDLGIRADSVLVIEVQCAAQARSRADLRWQAPGGFLVAKDHDHLLSVWQGVFLELTRDRAR